MSKEDLKISDVLASSIFDSMYDDEDLIELKKKKIIAQELGFKLSTIATISCEIDESELMKSHDKLKQERDEALESVSSLIDLMDIVYFPPEGVEPEIEHVDEIRSVWNAVLIHREKLSKLKGDE